MSFLDKLASAIMPPESEEQRAKARAEAEQLAQTSGWLAMAIDHHRQIEAAFARGLDPAADAPASSVQRGRTTQQCDGVYAGMNVEEAILVQQRGLHQLGGDLRQRCPESKLPVFSQREAQQLPARGVHGITAWKSAERLYLIDCARTLRS